MAPSYFHSHQAPKRILDTLGRINLLIIVRNPVERSISHYRHLISRGLVGFDIKKAVAKYPEIIDASRYAYHLHRWEEVFGIGAVRILRQGTLKENPIDFVQQLCQTLGVSSMAPPEELLYTKINTATVPHLPIVARFGWHFANFLRAHRIYAPIELAKFLGLKRFFFGSNNERKSKSFLSEEDKIWLEELLKDDWNIFRKRL